LTREKDLSDELFRLKICRNAFAKSAGDGDPYERKVSVSVSSRTQKIAEENRDLIEETLHSF
jgi:hypothetical protein